MTDIELEEIKRQMLAARLRSQEGLCPHGCAVMEVIEDFLKCPVCGLCDFTKSRLLS